MGFEWGCRRLRGRCMGRGWCGGHEAWCRSRLGCRLTSGSFFVAARKWCGWLSLSPGRPVSGRGSAESRRQRRGSLCRIFWRGSIFISVTSLSWALKDLILALKASAEALVDLLSKKLSISCSLSKNVLAMTLKELKPDSSTSWYHLASLVAARERLGHLLKTCRRCSARS